MFQMCCNSSTHVGYKLGRILTGNYLLVLSWQIPKQMTFKDIIPFRMIVFLSVVFRNIFRRNFRNHILQFLPLLLGRLAIDKKHQGKGIGKILLIDALKRSYEISQKIGSFALVVDPMDEESESFYKKYDFLTLPDSGIFFITIRTLNVLFG